MTAPSRDAPGVDGTRVAGWLRERGIDVRPPLAFTRFEGGRSNLTYRMTDAAGTVLVLRRPPLHGVLRSAHDMAREYRIVAALAPTPVPVPPAVDLCEDPEVIGAPFTVTGYVPGAVLRDAAGARAAFDARGRRRAADALVDTLVALHAVEADRVGLATLGRKEDYIARQLRTWARQWEQSRTRDLPAIEAARERLTAAIPPQQGSAIVHGDYRLDNVICAATGDIAAVVDWELCTLGDPLADLGLLLVYWSEAGEGRTALPDPPSALEGFPTRREIAERYRRGSGRDLGALSFYVAFAYWKLAIVLEGVHARERAGAYGTAPAGARDLREHVAWLAEAALAEVER